MYERFLYYGLGPFYRNTGKRLAESGLRIQGAMANDDRLVPSLRKLSHLDKIPSLDLTNFVAPSATIKGDVSIGEKSSVWYGAVLRGDQGKITIGARSVIQDLARLENSPEGQIKIGDNSIISSCVGLSSCTIGNNVLVGMGSTIGSGVFIEDYAVISPGSVIPDNTRVLSNQVWAGSPAKMIRMVTVEEREVLRDEHDELIDLAAIHSEETEKTFREFLNDEAARQWKMQNGIEDLMIERLEELGIPNKEKEEDLLEQRVWMRDMHETPSEDPTKVKYKDPYEQDLQNFPESFQILNRNYSYYEEMEKKFNESLNEPMEIIDRSGKKEPTDRSPWMRKF